MSGSDPIVLGVDGGGTKTSCYAVCTTSRSVKGKGVAGSGNWNSVGADAAFGAMKKSMEDAMKEAGASRGDVRAICIASAGVDRADDIQTLTSMVKVWFEREVRLMVHNDAVGALASGTCGVLHGCVLISGTGTIALGMTPDGRRARAAGWGPALGDAGSGYDIACQGLKAAVRASDGRGEETRLLSAVLEHLGLEAAEGLIGWAYAEQGWAHLAAVAPVVLKCAEEGDTVAVGIVAGAVEELVRSVGAVARQLGLGEGGGAAGEDGYPLVLAGGILTPGGIVPKMLCEKLSADLPGARPIHPDVEPAMGAALLACNDLSPP